MLPIYNATGFLDNLLYCLEKLTFSEYKVLICAKATTKRKKQKIEKVSGKYKNVEVFFHNPGTSGSTSTGKGSALDILIGRINTKYGVMMDADAVFLKKGWDNILLQHFNDEIKIGGAPRGSNKFPNTFPDSFLTIFDTQVFKDLKISMMPRHRSEAQGIGWDVGWEIYDKYTKAGYKSIIAVVRNTRTYKQGPFGGLLGIEEYYLDGDNHIFASHYGRGCSYLGSAKYKKGTNFIYRLPKIGRVFRMIKGKREKGKWLKICRGIVEK